MSYKVIIYSCHTIIQIGLSYCLKKCISNVSIVLKSILTQVFENNLDFDLYIFDTSQFTEMSYIYEKFASNLKEKKVVILVDNIKVEKILNFKNVFFIHKDKSEAEVLEQLRRLCKSKMIRPSFNNKNV